MRIKDNSSGHDAEFGTTLTDDECIGFGAIAMKNKIEEQPLDPDGPNHVSTDFPHDVAH